MRICKAILGMALVPLLASAQSSENTSANAGDWGNFEVGSGVIQIEPGIPSDWPIDVLLFYPADRQAYRYTKPSYYSSRLFGVTLDPARWDPVSWRVQAERAHEGVVIDKGGPSFPLIVFSHGNGGTPEKYAPLLERLASHGYVIAAPWHEGNNHDDTVIDNVNKLAGSKILHCFDFGPSPCADADFGKTLQNRARDVTRIIDNIGGYFGDRVDTSRVGLLGHSRGSVTALAAAGGSKILKIDPEARVSAIMLLEIGTRPNTFTMDVQNVDVPALLVNSRRDTTTTMDVSIDAFNTMPSDEKALVILEDAVHRVYGSLFCKEMQATGAILVKEKDLSKPRAIGESYVLQDMLLSANGTPMDFCFYEDFVNPVDLTALVETTLGCPSAKTCYRITPTSVPKTLPGITAVRLALELATTFFDATLVKRGQPGVHFKQYLDPKFELQKEGAAVSLSEIESWQGMEVACDDPALGSIEPDCLE